MFPAGVTIAQLGIEHLSLFGSTARGGAREESDIDPGGADDNVARPQRTQAEKDKIKGGGTATTTRNPGNVG
jgi:hypothetical protein